MKLYHPTMVILLALGCLGMPVTVMAQLKDLSNMSISSQGEQEQDYLCPMHPHIHGGPGDTCPICGMALVPVKTNEETPEDSTLSEEEIRSSHRIDPSLVQTIGIKTAIVNLEVFGDDIRAYGRIVPSTRVANKVTLRVEGWVEDLAASAMGDPIEKGQRLFNLNSPQLISAQTDYLTARQLGNEDIAHSAATRLKQLGVDKYAMELISKQKQALTTIPFHAPSDGVITKLNIRAGDYIKPGTPLLIIQDLSIVWVEADVPERQLPALKQDDRVMVSLPEVGRQNHGKITYIQPTVDPKTRTGQVRIELSNPDGLLKPDSYVDVIFSAEKQHRLAVPIQAVLRSSMGDYVLVWLGDGRFKSVMVSTGAKSDEFIEIRKGLEQGEKIVISGQFLLDAEANLRSGIGSMAGHNHGGGDMKDISQGTYSSGAQQPSHGGNPHAGH